MNQPPTPLHDRVPKDIHRNLLWRKRAIKACSNIKVRNQMLVACARDPIFWIDTFLWTFDPRSDDRNRVVPFVAWPYQEEALTSLYGTLGKKDACIAKSRDMGATWIVLALFVHAWLFKPMSALLLVSRVEDLVDKKDDPDSLFWKVDFILKHLPGWMRPEFERTSLKLVNRNNGSTITGASTTGDVSRGGRKTAILFDEFAAVPDGDAMMSASRDASNCRIFNSTPIGSGNAFHSASLNENYTQIRMHWSRHPAKAEGLYKVDANGRIKVLDEQHEFGSDYPFIRDGRFPLRSPWFDQQCLREKSEQAIAQELEINFHGSGAPYFDAEVINRIRSADCRPARFCGHFEFNNITATPTGVVEAVRGDFSMWLDLVDGKPPKTHDYVLGVDISTGTGATNSVISVGSRTTGAKVAEYVSRRIMPHEFALLAVAMARWFEGKSGVGFIIHEANGPGAMFGKVMMETGFRNFFWRENERGALKKVYDTPGFHTSRQEKALLLGDFRRALGAGTYIQRSAFAVDEARQYQYTQAGGISHPHSRNSLDSSTVGDNHGDRVIADALCWRAMRDEVEARVAATLAGNVEPEKKNTPDSYQFRLDWWKKQQRTKYWATRR